MPRFFGNSAAPMVMLGIVVLTFLVFLPYIGNSFVTLDDDYLIYNNPAVQEFSLKNITHVFSTYDPQLYIPLTFLSFQLNALILGMNATGFHFINVLLHVANVLVVFAVMRKLSGNIIVAGIAAALFAIHPLQTEAVMWASGRKDLLSGLFFLLSTWSYLRYRDNSMTSKNLYLSILFYGLGLLAKVSIIPLPLWLIGIDWLQKRQWNKQVITEKIPYVALAVIFGIVAVIGKTRVLGSSGTWLNVLLPSKSAVFYLQKFFWPTGLSVIYPYSGEQNLFTEFMPVIIVLGALCALFFFCAIRGYRLLAFGLFTYFLLLAPSFSTFWKNGFLYFASDRYAYLALMGVALIVGIAIHQLRKEFALGITALMLLALIPATWAQASVWKDSIALYSNVLRTYPESVMAHTNLGVELQLAGETDEARQHYEKAIELDPYSAHAYFNLAALLGREGKEKEAEDVYVKIIDIVQPQQIGSVNEAKPFVWLVGKLQRIGRSRDAERLLEKLRTIAPEFTEEAILEI